MPSARVQTKGRTPIIKNISVTDQQGNKYEATYLKRAKGLVKNGRARFIDEKTICLACPPNILEDKIMDKTDTVTLEINKAMAKNPQKDVSAVIQEVIAKQAEADMKPRYSLDYVLEKIEAVQKDTEYLKQAISELRQMEFTYQHGRDTANEEKVRVLGELIKGRETTNQQLIRFYEKMYDDLKPQKPVNVKAELLRLAENLPPDELAEFLDNQFARS